MLTSVIIYIVSFFFLSCFDISLAKENVFIIFSSFFIFLFVVARMLLRAVASVISQYSNFTLFLVLRYRLLKGDQYIRVLQSGLTETVLDCVSPLAQLLPIGKPKNKAIAAAAVVVTRTTWGSVTILLISLKHPIHSLS